MKKVISLILSFVFVFSLSVPAFASTPENKDEFSIDNYIPYTINLSEKSSNTYSTTDDSVDRASNYVKSLGLSDMGYSYLEEACLNELAAYKDDDVILENYTVLVPKNRAKNYYGSYLNKDFYYEYTSAADMRRETDGEKKNSSNKSKWDNWILGVADLGMCFSTIKWSIPYTIIRTVTGLSEPESIEYGSYNQYVEQFTNVVTRTIFREDNSRFKACFQDQSCSLRVKLYFCPVGANYDSDYIEIDTVYTGDVSASDLSKEEILRAAHVQANHGSKVIHKVTQHRLKEQWK